MTTPLDPAELAAPDLVFGNGTFRATRDRLAWHSDSGVVLHARRVTETAPNGDEYVRLATAIEDELLDRLAQEPDPAPGDRLGFFCTPRGHGLGDWCSQHGDIPRNRSIVNHIAAEHGLTYEEYGVLQRLDNRRRGITDEEAGDEQRRIGIAAATPTATEAAPGLRAHWPTLVFQAEEGDLVRCDCGGQGFDFEQGREWFAAHLAAEDDPDCGVTGCPLRRGHRGEHFDPPAAQEPDPAPGDRLDVGRLARAIAKVSPEGTKYPERLAAEYDKLA